MTPSSLPHAAETYERIARAIRTLEASVAAPLDLATLARAMDLSPAHAQRLFKRWAGVSPKRFVQALQVAAARERLTAAATVLDTTLDLGLSSTGRLHDLLVASEGLTPGEVRRQGDGLSIRYGRHGTPFGVAEIATSERGVCSLVFVDDEHDTDEAAGAATWPEATWVRDDAATAALADRAFGWSRPGAKPLKLHVAGTNLQLQVWRALLQIPEGRVVAYGDLAGALGRPRAARAVASAVAANPIAYLIPCHRVLRSSGALGGYRWGMERKRLLLGREFAAAEGPA